MPPDHPRSRGVYSPRPSSPPGRSDHPRSRGVYRGYPMISVGTRGSSPLARGLRERLLGVGHGLGIIPARAGFTPERTPHEPVRQDHPRSRGVYERPDDPAYRARGSSPLARGLQERTRGRRGMSRIIPARAGFTPTGPTPTSPRADHPRSRGVYVNAFGTADAISGSSPLARGLPPYTAMRRTPSPGSSPLARGLPTLDAPIPTGYRIIPARAGFTPPATSGTRSWEDHPRSRGVYTT